MADLNTIEKKIERVFLAIEKVQQGLERIEESQIYLDARLMVIEEYLQGVEVEETQEITTQTQEKPTQFKTFVKDKITMQELLQYIPEQSMAFASSIINNEYPTVTEKQYNALVSLAQQVGYDKPLIK